jgi:drug efflux transport system ATP-binding protein
MEALRAQALSKTFGGVKAVDALSLTVERGEVFALVGPDGAGKTTTLRMLAAILDPTSGDAWVAGHHTVREAAAVSRAIGYMSQRFGLYSDLTVMENMDFYADIYSVPRRGRAEKVERLLAFSNLTPFKKRLAGNLSGGMKQKLGLACALIHTPQALLLDEPTNGVDPSSRRDFWRILYQLRREQVTIFLSTAYLDEAERAHRIALMDHGRLLAVGSPEEVKRLMRGRILEIRASDPRRAAALLRARLGADAVKLFGDRVHVVTGDPASARRLAELALAEAGMSPAALRDVAPSLEDVFVSVLGEKEGGARDLHGE